jgi:hypothetical protein
MAKRRKMTKKSPVRRTKKRMGSIAGGTGDTLKQALFIVGGMAASKLIVNGIAKLAPQLDKPIAKAGGQIVLGLITKPIAGVIGVKSANLNAFGTGMIVGGSFELVKTFAPKVLGQTDEGDVVIISGSEELSELNGMDEIGNSMELSELNGMDEIGEMFEIGY